MTKKSNNRRPKLSKQDYEKLRRSAYEYVVVQGYDQKQTAQLLNVSEVTLSKWSQEDDYRGQRQARQQSYRTEVENIKQIIRIISSRRLELEKEIQDAQKIGDKEMEETLRKHAKALGDEISKWNKAQKDMNKDNKYTLGEFINIMDDIFTAMRQYDEDLFNKTIPFQTYYVRKRTQELG